MSGLMVVFSDDRRQGVTLYAALIFKEPGVDGCLTDVNGATRERNFIYIYLWRTNAVENLC